MRTDYRCGLITLLWLSMLSLSVLCRLDATLSMLKTKREKGKKNEGMGIGLSKHRYERAGAGALGDSILSRGDEEKDRMTTPLGLQETALRPHPPSSRPPPFGCACYFAELPSSDGGEVACLFLGPQGLGSPDAKVVLEDDLNFLDVESGRLGVALLRGSRRADRSSRKHGTKARSAVSRAEQCGNVTRSSSSEGNSRRRQRACSGLYQ